MSEHNYTPWPLNGEETVFVNKYTCRHWIQSHKHDFIEMVFIARGSCTHRYLNTEATLIPGDFFIVAPHTTHAYDMDSETVIYNCLLYPQALGDDYKFIKEVGGMFDLFMVEPFFRDEIGKQQIIHASPNEALKIETLLNTMIDEHIHQRSGYQILQKANLITLIVILARIHEQTFDAKTSAFTKKRELLAQALSYVEQHIDDEVTIEGLAAKVFLSPAYFRKIFKQTIGLTPIEYINNIRIKKAIDLLKENRYPISEIAQMVGITDNNYFSRIFRSVMGCSPSEFAKNYK